MVVIPQAHFTPYLPPGITWVYGQLEKGESNPRFPYVHWQFVLSTPKQVRGSFLIKTFGQFHIELTRSAFADDYCCKDATAVLGTRFELGKKALKKNCAKDWDKVKELAIAGRLSEIDAGTYICHFANLKRIAVEHMAPVAMERVIHVYWGPTGVGKSRRAWAEAGLTAYPKAPTSKFWDGYRDQARVVMDEFRGSIDVSHILRWFDRYPVIIEVKGSATVLSATTIWVTSNISPEDWYPGIDSDTRAALLRRLTIEHMTTPWLPGVPLVTDL